MTASFAWKVDVHRFGRFRVSPLRDEAEALARLIDVCGKTSDGGSSSGY